MKRTVWYVNEKSPVDFDVGEEEKIQVSIEDKFKSTFIWVKGFKDQPSFIDQYNKDLDIKYDSDLHAGVKNLVKPVHINPADLLTATPGGRSNPFSDIIYNKHSNSSKLNQEYQQLKDWASSNLNGRELAYFNYAIDLSGPGVPTQEDYAALSKEFHYTEKQYPAATLLNPITPEPSAAAQLLTNTSILDLVKDTVGRKKTAKPGDGLWDQINGAGGWLMTTPEEREQTVKDIGKEVKNDINDLLPFDIDYVIIGVVVLAGLYVAVEVKQLIK